MRWIFLIFWVSASVAGASDRKLPLSRTSNELLEIRAQLILDREESRKALGGDMGPDYAAVQVTVRARSEKPVNVSRDDFYLISDKDGARSLAYAPSQIAGSSALVVTTRQAHGEAHEGKRRPSFGGIGGAASPGMVGTGADATTDTQVSTKTNTGNETLLQTLKTKELQATQLKEEETGFLYFSVAPKLKPKNLELHYKGDGGSLAMRFE